MKTLACLFVVLGIMLLAPASNAIGVHKIQSIISPVETVKATRKSRAQCYKQCLNECSFWWFCADSCKCSCYGQPKGCSPQ
jgi:hypothetical protein